MRTRCYPRDVIVALCEAGELSLARKLLSAFAPASPPANSARPARPEVNEAECGVQDIEVAPDEPKSLRSREPLEGDLEASRARR
jgi:hypothetical protein